VVNLGFPPISFNVTGNSEAGSIQANYSARGVSFADEAGLVSGSDVNAAFHTVESAATAEPSCAAA
jgi:hypothetical protein